MLDEISNFKFETHPIYSFVRIGRLCEFLFDTFDGFQARWMVSVDSPRMPNRRLTRFYVKPTFKQAEDCLFGEEDIVEEWLEHAHETGDSHLAVALKSKQRLSDCGIVTESLPLHPSLDPSPFRRSGVPRFEDDIKTRFVFALSWSLLNRLARLFESQREAGAILSVEDVAATRACLEAGLTLLVTMETADASNAEQFARVVAKAVRWVSSLIRGGLRSHRVWAEVCQDLRREIFACVSVTVECLRLPRLAESAKTRATVACLRASLNEAIAFFELARKVDGHLDSAAVNTLFITFLAGADMAGEVNLSHAANCSASIIDRLADHAASPFGYGKSIGAEFGRLAEKLFAPIALATASAHSWETVEVLWNAWRLEHHRDE